MMRRILIAASAAVAVVVASTGAIAGAFDAEAAPISGIVGIYAIVQRVAFEPDSAKPERIRIWGAFAFVDGGIADPVKLTAATRGQLYFHLHPYSISGQPATDVIRKEWADMRSVAGTGQAIAFGEWNYFGTFSPSVVAPSGLYTLGRGFTANPTAIGTWIRADSASKGEPQPYLTNAGVVKLSETGGHADIIRQLRAALR